MPYVALHVPEKAVYDLIVSDTWQSMYEEAKSNGSKMTWYDFQWIKYQEGIFRDPDIDYNSFDEDYSPKTPFDSSTLKNVCEAWKDNSKPIEKCLLDKFQTPNFDTAVT
eukprot:2369097-Ditylum_brightwellii.AAC.1